MTPGNEGCGYVLRRMMRRAVRAARLLGVEGQVLPQLMPVARDAMALSYPELATDYDRISMIAHGEEEVFSAIGRRGRSWAVPLCWAVPGVASRIAPA